MTNNFKPVGYSVSLSRLFSAHAQHLIFWEQWLKEILVQTFCSMVGG